MWCSGPVMGGGTRRTGSGGLGRSGSERDLSSRLNMPRASTKVQRSQSGMVRSTSNLEDAVSKASYNVDFRNTPGTYS